MTEANLRKLTEKIATRYTISPYRFNSLYGAGQAAEMAKQPGKATAYYQQLLKVCASGNSNRVELAHAQEFLSTVAAQN